MGPEWRRERTLCGYLDEVAAATPTPGGGSVAAIVGALGAALGEMVINLTLGHGQDAAAEQMLVENRERLTALRETLTGTADADEEAYASYRQAATLPRGSAEKKAARTAAMQAALLVATDVPLRVAKASAEIADVMQTVARHGNPHLRSDAALGSLLADTALRGALLNVRGNAALLRDRERAKVYLDEADRLEQRGREAAERAYRTATEATG